MLKSFYMLYNFFTSSSYEHKFRNIVSNKVWFTFFVNIPIQFLVFVKLNNDFIIF